VEVNYYRDESYLKRCKETLPFNFVSRCQLSECHIKAIVVISVAEIVDVVSLNSILAIINSSLPRSFSSSSEISFQCRCPCVQNTNAISVISPSLTECLLKRSIKLLKWITSRLSSDVHLPYLLVSDVPTDDRLNDVSSVKAVHAIGTNVSLLAINDLTCAICDFLSLVHAKL